MKAYLCLLGLIALPLSGCDSAKGAFASRSSVPNEPKGARFVATAVGRIDSASEARQLVAATDGVIHSILVQRGERVHAGQLLLTVDCAPRIALVAVRDAEADRLNAVADTVLAGSRPQQLDVAQQAVRHADAARAEESDKLSQAQALVERGFMSRRELTARQNAVAAAEALHRSAMSQASLVAEGPRQSERRAAIAGARAAKMEARVASGLAQQCGLRSPVDGEVLQLFRREGEFSGASQGTPLISVGDLSKLVVRTEINERDAAIVSVGQQAEVWIEGGKERWKGRVASMAMVMGRRSARSLDPTDRFDRDIREAFVELDGPLPPALVGLRVMVGVRP